MKHRRKTIVLTILFTILFFVASIYFGRDAYDPRQGRYPARYGKYELQKPLDGLQIYRLKHPYFTPYIFIFGDTISHLEMGKLLLFAIPYWLVISFVVSYGFTNHLTKKNK